MRQFLQFSPVCPQCVCPPLLPPHTTHSHCAQMRERETAVRRGRGESDGTWRDRRGERREREFDKEKQRNKKEGFFKNFLKKFTVKYFGFTNTKGIHRVDNNSKIKRTINTCLPPHQHFQTNPPLFFFSSSSSSSSSLFTGTAARRTAH